MVSGEGLGRRAAIEGRTAMAIRCGVRRERNHGDGRPGDGAGHARADLQRRSLLLGLTGAAALVAVPPLWAADAPGWPSGQFNQAGADGVLASLDAADAEVSPLVQITAPTLAQDGATVPFTVRTQLEHVDRIAVVVPKNPIPLASEYHFPEGTEAYVVNRLKMKGTDDIIALAHTRDGKTFRASTHVKVTVGGCG